MERPKVVKASATDIPAFFINMSLTDEDDDGVVASSRELFPVSPKFMELSRFAGQVIAKRIEQIPQVAMVDVSGLSYPELLIVPDRKKLESLGISEPNARKRPATQQHQIGKFDHPGGGIPVRHPVRIGHSFQKGY